MWPVATIAKKSDSASNYAGCRMRNNANTELGWPAVAFLFAIAVFGVVLIGHEPKWPIYVSVLAWWGFVIYRAMRT
jgi:hypothetical protein